MLTTVRLENNLQYVFQFWFSQDRMTKKEKVD